MADCECLAKCIFFNDRMASKPATAQILKKQYCQGNSSECARYVVFKALGGEHVPPDLYPSQKDRVEKILASARA